MKKLFLIPLFFLLTACPGGTDGYTFEKAEYTKTNFTVEMVLYDDLKSLQKASGLKLEDRELKAFSVLHKNNCQIHIVKPSANYEPEWIGHELTHCIHGRWHP